MPIIALVLVAAAFAMPVSKVRQASRVPRIHDITTDTDRPPRFVSVVPLRAGAPNPVEYGGPEVAAQQRQGYPTCSRCRCRCRRIRRSTGRWPTARVMGWEIVASDPQSGRIEATDTTFWFGFKDDVVIRVAPAPERQPRRCAIALPRGAQRRGDERRPHPQVPRGAQERLVDVLIDGFDIQPLLSSPDAALRGPRYT